MLKCAAEEDTLRHMDDEYLPEGCILEANVLLEPYQPFELSRSLAGFAAGRVS